jgi:hypothetical protein
MIGPLNEQVTAKAVLPEHDLLSLFVGAVVVDTIAIAMNYARFVFVSDELTRWYTTCRSSALLMDALVIVLYVTLGMRLARRYGLPDLACILGVQVASDLLFYALFNALPDGLLVFDIFKDYAAEVGLHALWADGLLVAGTYYASRCLLGASEDAKRLALIGSVYVSQYVLFLR